jgi:error-prone DNA polymerase
LLALAAADALVSLVGNRHIAAWEVAGLVRPLPLAASRQASEALPLLPLPEEGETIAADYASLGLTLRRHPLSLLRGQLRRHRLLSAEEVGKVPPGRTVAAAGLVVNRQRPASANSVTFVTLEDETGYINLVVYKRIAEHRRKVLLGARLLGAVGEIQRESGVTHLVARRLLDYSPLLGELVVRSRDFR